MQWQCVRLALYLLECHTWVLSWDTARISALFSSCSFWASSSMSSRSWKNQRKQMNVEFQHKLHLIDYCEVHKYCKVKFIITDTYCYYWALLYIYYIFKTYVYQFMLLLNTCTDFILFYYQWVINYHMLQYYNLFII